MPLELRAHENVLFPMPYVETEAYLLVITNHRVIDFSDEGRKELPTEKISFTNRLQTRPFVLLGVFLALLGLPFVGYGAYFIINVWGMNSASYVPELPKGDSAEEASADSEAPPQLPDDDPERVGQRQVRNDCILGAVLIGVGLLSFLGALKLFRKKRYYVACRAGKVFTRILVAGETEQTQVLLTIQAVQGKPGA